MLSGHVTAWAVPCTGPGGPELSPPCRFPQPEHAGLRLQRPINRTCIFVRYLLFYLCILLM